MFTFLRSKLRHPRVDDGFDRPWMGASACAEYRAVGIELRLIDLVDERARAVHAGRGDLGALDAEISALQDELAQVSTDPLAADPLHPAA